MGGAVSNRVIGNVTFCWNSDWKSLHPYPLIENSVEANGWRGFQPRGEKANSKNAAVENRCTRTRSLSIAAIQKPNLLLPGYIWYILLR